MKLNLTRPLAFFDLETTGLNVVKDKIVEISIFKVNPDNSTETLTTLINPQIPISPEASSVHGISNDDVKDKPTFIEFAPKLDKFLKNCDLAGYNSNKFDVPMLIEEFLRCGINFDIKKRKLIDVQNIFHKMEPRTLKAAYKFYCGKELIGAHEAEADTMATYEILLNQIEFYKETEYTNNDGIKSFPIKNDVGSLSEFSYNQNNADLVGHIGFNKSGKEIFNFGKYKGKTVEEVFKIEPQYYDWMMKAEFPLSTKNIITEIMFRGFKDSSIIVK
ncbi:MAG: 3'-5' exonuclease [Bacteroidetes bacterium]|nr:3'-5' exonuclease [Bacteroidota bacterium]